MSREGNDVSSGCLWSSWGCKSHASYTRSRFFKKFFYRFLFVCFSLSFSVNATQFLSSVPAKTVTPVCIKRLPTENSFCNRLPPKLCRPAELISFPFLCHSFAR